MSKQLCTLKVNGDTCTVAADTHHTLLEVLREELGLTGTKHGCELGECGACTVLVNGTPMLACLTLPQQIEEAEITTVEGLAVGAELNPIQIAFAEQGAAQCGYCTPGHDAQRQGAARSQSVAEPRRDCACHQRQPVPLHRVHGHLRSHRTGGEHDGRRSNGPRVRGINAPRGSARP